MRPIPVDECQILRGYDCAIHLSRPNSNGGKTALFKADLSSKLTSRKTVHEMAQEIAIQQSVDPLQV